MPGIGQIAAHLGEESAVVAHRMFGFARQRQRLRHVPGWQHTSMHHQPAVAADDLVMRQFLLRHPVEQHGGVGRIKHFTEGVAAMRFAVACGAGQHEQIVIAQH